MHDYLIPCEGIAVSFFSQVGRVNAFLIFTKKKQDIHVDPHESKM